MRLVLQARRARLPLALGVLLATAAGAERVVEQTGALASTERLPAPGVSKSAVLLELPHIRQEHNLCVPTSAAMVLAYYGDAHPPRELKVLSRDEDYDPADPFEDFTLTWWRDLIRNLRRLGHYWNETTYPNDAGGFRAGLADISASLRRGQPVLVDVALYGSHTFVIVGYDEALELVFIRDPMLAAPGYRVLSLAQLESIWNGVSYGLDARPALFTRRKPGRGSKREAEQAPSGGKPE